MKALSKLRQAGIKAEMYPDAAKLGKQFQHADKRGIPFAVMAGDQEMEDNRLTMKDLVSGEQEVVDLELLISKLK